MRRRTGKHRANEDLPSLVGYDEVLGGIVELLDAARRTSVRAVNAVMTATYWEVGRRIVDGEQRGAGRADYGTLLLKRLGTDLTRRFGEGFSWRNLYRMRSFYAAYANILPTASAKSATGDEAPVARGKLPTASAKSASVLAEGGLQGSSGESSVQILQTASAKLAMPRFPLPWSHYVRYLNYVSENWALPDENPPVGVILCAEKDEAVVHYALEGLRNKVLAAEYQMVLPDERLLVAELKRTQRMLETRKIVLPERDK